MLGEDSVPWYFGHPMDDCYWLNGEYVCPDSSGPKPGDAHPA